MPLKPTPHGLLVLLAVSLLPALGGIAWLAWSEPTYRVPLAVLAGWSLALGAAVRSAVRSTVRSTQWRWVEPLVLVAASFHLVVLGPEALLRAAGFRHESGIRFGYPRPSAFTYFQADEDLFWTLRPGEPGVSSWGFRGPEVRSPKPAGVERIVVLGDSVAFQGWPALLEERLAATPGGRHREVVNLGLSGYSSHQGRILSEKYAAHLEADRVIVAYGWNDHWLAWGEEDAVKKIRVDDSGIHRLGAEIYRRLRLLQAMRWLASQVLGAERLGAEGPSGRPRVSLDAYRGNLRAMVGAFKERGARLLLLTAASHHALAGVPAELIELGLAASPESVVELHRAYNEAVREVARHEGVELLDLVPLAEGAARPEALFLDDGIHLSDEGLAWLADHVAAVLAETR